MNDNEKASDMLGAMCGSKNGPRPTTLDSRAQPVAAELMTVAEACVAQRCTIAMEDWLDGQQCADTRPAVVTTEFTASWASLYVNGVEVVASKMPYGEGYIRSLYKRIQDARPAGGVTDEQRTAIRDAVAIALSGTYYCGRVWSAWQYNTMGEDDFTPAAEVDDVLDGVVDAAIDAMKSVGPAATLAASAALPAPDDVAKDAARLDFLDGPAVVSMHQYEPRDDERYIAIALDMPGSPTVRGSTLREAIDTARATVTAAPTTNKEG